VKQILKFSAGLNGSGENSAGGRRKHTHGYVEIGGDEGTDYQ
jgi:hypothetical protein